MLFYIINLGTLLAIFIILGISYNLLLGYSGQFSLGHAAFFGLGAYVTGLLSKDLGFDLLLALLVATIVGGAIGLLIGYPARRVHGIFLVLMTIGLAYVFVELVGILEITGGKNGLVGIPASTIFGIELNRNGLLILVWVVALLVTWLTRSGLRSPFGRLLEGIRENELAARSLGKRTGSAKVQAFMTSAALAALAGGLFTAHLRYISPTEFDLHRMIEIISIVIIGGVGVFWGPYFGAIIVVVVPQLLTFLEVPSALAGNLNIVIFSLILLLIIRFRPQGLGFVKRKVMQKAVVEAEAEELPPPAPRKQVEVECKGVSISFGGLKAVDKVDLTLRPGQITGLIGPNGAGKTTLFNIISGVLEPTEGEVLLDGEKLNGLSLEKRVERGVVRSFQDMKLFLGMTCEQNLLLPATPTSGEQVYTAALRARKTEPVRRAEAQAMLQRLGLGDSGHKLASDLSYAEQKRLMIGRLLATEADVYLLDEPMSGLDEEGRATILKLLTELAEQGATLCLVEHSLSVIESVCTQVAFLSDGRLVKYGPAAEVLRDPELTAIYFGTVAGK